MKNRNRLIISLILVLLCGLMIAQAADWKLIGKKTVKLRTERDVILVGEKEGTFRAIKLGVRKSGINLKDMKVHFGNGSVFDVKVRKIIPAGGETRAINLPGKDRIIEKVVFWYKSTNRNDKQAKVRLWGLP